VKIVYLSQAGAIGGAERVLLDTIASVRAANPEWQLRLIAAAEGPLIAEARRLRVDVQALPLPSALARLGDAAVGEVGAGFWLRLGRLGLSAPAVAAYARRLGRELAAAAPDVVHANGFKMHLLGARATPPRSALLWHVHDFVGARPLVRRLLAGRADRCRMMVANSRAVAQDLRETLGGAAPIATVYNAVDLQHFAPQGPILDLDTVSGFASATAGTLRVGLVATGARWKGHATFLDALAQLPQAPLVRGYVIGGPIYQTRDSQFSIDQLRGMAAARGLADRVAFTGYQSDTAAAMRALDVVVHASVAPEPFGLVIAEAFACGRAVITSGSGGSAELVEIGRNALTHKPGDAASLAAAISRLAGDAVLRARLAAAGRATAERRFDRERLGAEFSAIYRQLTASAERRDATAACS
jgi:glycosyltransferase involved in cell wall biosynthesis